MLGDDSCYGFYVSWQCNSFIEMQEKCVSAISSKGKKPDQKFTTEKLWKINTKLIQKFIHGPLGMHVNAMQFFTKSILLLEFDLAIWKDNLSYKNEMKNNIFAIFWKCLKYTSVKDYDFWVTKYSKIL